MAGYAGQPEDGAGAFGQRTRELFEQAMAELESAEYCGLTHDALEDRLTERCREITRSMFQDQLDLRALREQRRDDVVDAEGVARTRVEPGHHRDLVTVFGTVTATRMAYRAPGRCNLYPADAVLNLPAGGWHSHGLRRLVAREAARGSYEQAVAAVERATGVRLGKRQAEKLAVAAAADMAGFYARVGRLYGPLTHLVVLTFDGKGVVMRPEALRPATARAAASGGPKLATRLSAGEKHGRKRMAEVAAVYEATPAPRTPADVITPPGAPRDGRRAGPAARAKWLTASVTDDIPTVVAAAFDEAERRDPAHSRPWVALVDGNLTQIEAIQAEAARREATVAIVVDFVHVLEYLWKAAWCFFAAGNPAAEAWVAGKATKVLEGKAGDVATGIRRRATAERLAESRRKNADTAANYLDNKAPFLGYDSALARGWPIATGVIEGACRYLVKDRMDITGARWGLEGAEAVLRLRAIAANGDFDDYYAHHLREEQQRVHYSKYQDRYALAA